MTPPKSDDLTVISGIGKARQAWLRAAFQARTLNDLANLSADDIEARLKADGQIVSHDKIESWIQQARQLAATPPKPIAQFVVEFRQYRDEDSTVKYQTKVHHMEADKSASWPGIEQAELGAWMAQELRQEIGQPAMKPAGEGADSSERFHRLLAKAQGQAIPSESKERYHAPAPRGANQANARVQVSKLELLPFLVIHDNQPFTIQAQFQVVGAAAPAEYHAQFYAHERVTGARIDLGAVEGFNEGQTTQTAALRDVQLGCGTYQLQVIIRARGAAGVGYGELPFVQVIR